MPYNQCTKNFIKTIPKLTPSVWKENKIHCAKWPNQTNWCAECHSKIKQSKYRMINSGLYDFTLLWWVFYLLVWNGGICIERWRQVVERWKQVFWITALNSEVCSGYSFSAAVLWEKVGPVGHFAGDRQSNPAFATVLLCNLVAFSALRHFACLLQAYRKHVLKGFSTSIKILVNIVIFEDIFFIP